MLPMLFVLCAVLSSVVSQENDNCRPQGIGRVVLSHWVWRHGDRTPGYQFPTDKYKEREHWPVGSGQLTNTGKQQHYTLGKFLRRVYGDFLPPKYDPRDIYVRSTDYDRTIMSALSNMASLYAPQPDELFKTDLNWQPVPVHVVPAKLDYLIGGELPSCPRFKGLLAGLLDSQEIIDLVDKYTEKNEFMLDNSGTREIHYMGKPHRILDTIMSYAMVRDTLLIESIYNKTQDPWAEEVYPTEASEEMYYLMFTMMAYNPPMAKLRMGYFLKEVLEHCTLKSQNRLKPDYKVFAYSAHDIVVTQILKGMGLFHRENYDYAVALLINLRQFDNGYYFQMSVRKHPDDETAYRIRFENCDNSLSVKLEHMYELYKDILPDQPFDELCKPDSIL